MWGQEQYLFHSRVVGQRLFTGDPQLFELIILTVLAGAAVWVILEVVHLVGRSILRQRYGLNRVVWAITERTRSETELHRRIGRLTDRLAAAGDERQRLRRRTDALERELQETLSIQSHHVRVLGDETVGKASYNAYVYNRHVEHWAQMGRSHAFIHDSWGKPQLVQVWADSEAEARRTIDTRYSNAFGFVVMRVMPTGVKGTAADAD